MERAQLAFEQNEENKAIRMERKRQEKEYDIQISKEYVARVNAAEQKKRDEFQARADRIQEHMTKAEKGVIQDENQKIQFLENMIKTHEEKKAIQDKLDDERRKKKRQDQAEDLMNVLRDQMEEKKLKSRQRREVNNEYVQVFTQKAQSEIEKEKAELEEKKVKQR